MSAINGKQQISAVTLSDNIVSIASYSIYTLPKLTVLTLPQSLISIGTCGIYLINATEVDLPSGVTTIEDMGIVLGFMDKELTHIFNDFTLISRNPVPPTIGDDVLSTHTLSIKVPAASVEAYKAADKWKDYASIIQAI